MRVMRESAIDIVVDVPDIASLPYWRHMATLGVPPHVTLLYPWRPAPIDPLSVAALLAVAEEFAPFTMWLGRVETFPKGVVYATVGPDDVLRSTTITGPGLRAIFARVPASWRSGPT